MPIEARTSQASRASYYAGMALGAVVVAAIGWMSIRTGKGALGPLSLSPNEVDHTAKVVFEGDHIASEFSLQNETGAAVRIDRFETSCNCTRMVASDRRTLPFAMKAGESVTCIADVDAEPTFNDLRVGLSASGEAGSHAVQATASILLRVKKRIEAEPPTISFGELDRQAEKFKSTVRLMRHRDAGVSSVTSVGFSNPAGARLVMVRGPGSEEAAAGEGPLPFYDLVVQIDPSKLPEKVSEKITVEFDRGKPLVIPILGWISSTPKATTE